MFLDVDFQPLRAVGSLEPGDRDIWWKVVGKVKNENFIQFSNIVPIK